MEGCSSALYLVILEGQMLQVGCGVALDRVKAVVEHGDDLGQLGLPPCGGHWALVEGAVQRGHAASLAHGQGCPTAPVVHVPGSAHVPIKGALITPEAQAQTQTQTQMSMHTHTQSKRINKES